MSDEHSVIEQASNRAEPSPQAWCADPGRRYAMRWPRRWRYRRTRSDDERDLFELGLDSLTLMGLVGAWRRRGSAVTFQDLVKDPALGAWIALLKERTAGHPSASAADVPSRALDPDPASTSFDAFDEQAPFALATMQHAYWIGRQDGQPLGGVAAHFYVELDGDGVDPRTARRRPARPDGPPRHAAGPLRRRGPPALRRSPAPRLIVHDLRELTAGEVTDTLEALRERHTHGHLDIAAGEVFRARPLPAARRADPAAARPGHDGRRRDEPARPAQRPAPAATSVPTNRCPRSASATAATWPSTPGAAAPSDERAARWWRERLPELPRAPRLPTAVDPLRPGTPPTPRSPTPGACTTGSTRTPRPRLLRAGPPARPHPRGGRWPPRSPR